jgi:hypothetical protein
MGKLVLGFVLLIAAFGILGTASALKTQGLLNQTLTAEQLTKQYLEVLHDMRNSNNLVIMVPTQGGIPMLDINALRSNLRQH